MLKHDANHDKSRVYGELRLKDFNNVQLSFLSVEWTPVNIVHIINATRKGWVFIKGRLIYVHIFIQRGRDAIGTLVKLDNPKYRTRKWKKWR